MTAHDSTGARRRATPPPAAATPARGAQLRPGARRALAPALIAGLLALSAAPAHAALSAAFAPGHAASGPLDATCPSPWTCADIGNPSPAGSQSYDAATGTWQISGGGPAFDASGEQDRFVSQPLTGDGSVSAQVLSQNGPQTGSTQPRAGVMWRQSSAANAPFYSLYVTPNPPNTNLQGEGIFIKYRGAVSGNLIKELRPWDGKMPIYLKITRSGTTFASYLSSDGVNWFFIPESAFVLNDFAGAENALVGMFVNSDTSTQLNTATFNSVQLGPLASGTFSDNLAGTGASSSYSFVPWLSGPITAGSCAATKGYVFDIALSNSAGATIGSGGGQLTCNYATATVTAGQPYTVTTTAVSGSGKYISAWSVSAGGALTPVVLSLANTTSTEPATITDTSAPYSITTPGGSQSVSFPTLSATGAISLDTCSAPGTTFGLALRDAGGATLASATTPSAANCEAITLAPGYAGLFRLVETAISGTGVWTGTITTELPAGSPPPTATPTDTPVAATATNTPLATNVPTATNTPVPPTATTTPPAPTATATPSGAAPVAFNPPSLTFGSQPLGTLSLTQTVRLTNNGTTPLTITIVAPTGPNGADFATGGTCAHSTVAPGASCAITVSFRPGGAGARSGSVAVLDSAGNGVQVVPLSGTGSAAQPSLGVAPSSGLPGTAVTFTGHGFGAGETVSIKYNCGQPACTSTQLLGTPTADGTGSVTLHVNLPTSTSVGSHPIGAKGNTSGVFASTSFTIT